LIIKTVIKNLALPPLLYAMVWTLGEKLFETLEILPKWFARILSKLHDVFPNKQFLWIS